MTEPVKATEESPALGWLLLLIACGALGWFLRGCEWGAGEEDCQYLGEVLKTETSYVLETCWYRTDIGWSYR